MIATQKRIFNYTTYAVIIVIVYKILTRTRCIIIIENISRVTATVESSTHIVTNLCTVVCTRVTRIGYYKRENLVTFTNVFYCAYNYNLLLVPKTWNFDKSERKSLRIQGYVSDFQNIKTEDFLSFSSLIIIQVVCSVLTCCTNVMLACICVLELQTFDYKWLNVCSYWGVC